MFVWKPRVAGCDSAGAQASKESGTFRVAAANQTSRNCIYTSRQTGRRGTWMYRVKYPERPPIVRGYFVMALLGVLASILSAVPVRAQSSSSNPSAQSQPTQSQQDQMPAAAGGPTGESGSIAVPKKKETEE